MEPLLQNISASIPDEKIDHELFFSQPCRGPRPLLKPSQMYRIHLLFCLKRLASFRQLRSDLVHHQDWRLFAHRKNKNQVPTLRAMSAFRQRAPELLRQINQLYLKMIFTIVGVPSAVIAVPDSTDIEASTRGYAKKTVGALDHASIPEFILLNMQPKDTVPKNPDNPHSSLVTRSTLSASSFSASLPPGPSPL
jgi:hypothetical protein